MHTDKHTPPTTEQLARLVETQQQLAALTKALAERTLAPRPKWGLPGNLLAIFSVAWIPLALSAPAFARIPSANGIITACCTSGKGEVRVIDAEAGQKCSYKEVQLTWNQTGPQGPQGPKGDTGPIGPQGPKGDKGLNWRDEWLPGTVYEPGDAVTSGGASFIATQTTSEQPGPKIDLGMPWGILSLRGAQRPQGAQGAPGIIGYENVTVDSVFDSTTAKDLYVACPAGKRIIGGGAEIFPSLDDPNRATAPIVLTVSIPVSTSDEWIAHAVEIGSYTFAWKITGTAICANTGP